MTDFYEYSGYNDFNRFINIDGIEGKIVAHLLTSETKYAQMLWKLLKYDSKDALTKDNLSLEERKKLVDGMGSNANQTGGQTGATRLFFSPFVDDAWVDECSSVYIYVDDIYPVDHMRAVVSVLVETVIHSKINAILNDADEISNPEETNPNDYYYKDNVNPAVIWKSRASVLLKCLLAELNGLYIDGVGYLAFNTDKSIDGDSIKGKATLSLFNRRSFFGHQIRFNVVMSGMSDNPEEGF